jgi:hypothetical protein
MNKCQPFLSRSSLALSYDSRVWMPLGSTLTTGAMPNGRESTQNSQVGFVKTPQSYSLEPYQKNSVMIQTIGKVLITKRVNKFVKPETMKKGNGMLYIVCHLIIRCMLGPEYFENDSACIHSLIAKIGECIKNE